MTLGHSRAATYTLWRDINWCTKGLTRYHVVDSSCVHEFLLELVKLNNSLSKYQEREQDFHKIFIQNALLENLQMLMRIGKKERLKIQLCNNLVEMLKTLKLLLLL